MSSSHMLQLDQAVPGAAFAVAPEKAEELLSRVRNIKLEFLYEPHQKGSGIEPFPKTDAGFRDVVLTPVLATLLKRYIGNRTGGFPF